MDLHEKNTLLLTQLIALFQTAALQQMGKLKNPVSDRIEQGLHQAQISIDMLEMLHAKTKGNLTSEEERMFSTVLSELRLNYVDEATKAQAAGSDPGTAPTPITTSKPAS